MLNPPSTSERSCSHAACPAPDGRCWRERYLDAAQGDFGLSREDASAALHRAADIIEGSSAANEEDG